MNILIVGGTGFIGRHLCNALIAQNHTVFVGTRQINKLQESSADGVEYVLWDNHNPPLLPPLDVIINLAGSKVTAKRWTSAIKQELLESRTSTTQALAKAIRLGIYTPSLVINGSAMGYYGHCSDYMITESNLCGNDFLAHLAQVWENEAWHITDHHFDTINPPPRLALLRTGLVLGDGGALPMIARPYRYGIGGSLGSGTQWLPWIHIEDLVSLILHIIETPALEGAINACSPHPEQMNDFSRLLGKVLHRLNFVRVPEYMLKALMGEMSLVILNSQRGFPEKALVNGFIFKHSDLEEALCSLSLLLTAKPAQRILRHRQPLK